METKFKDVAHLYLGCELDTDCHGQGIQGHMPISFKELDADNLATILYQLSNDDWGHYCKPILRPLSDMQPKEAEEYFKIENSRDGVSGFVSAKGNILVNWYNDNGWGTTTADGNEMIVKQNKLIKNPSANQFVYLLSKHFDLFGLIESGEAVDKTKL